MKKSFLDIVEEALVNVDEVDCIQLKHAKDNEEDFILIDSRKGKNGMLLEFLIRFI